MVTLFHVLAVRWTRA